MRKKGFTLIEVSLVIALTGAIFIAFFGSVRGTLATRRYSIATETFTEFIRGIYNSVAAVQNNGYGNSGQAIYGKLVTFGERGKDTIHVYDVIGNAVSGDALGSGYGLYQALQVVDVNIFNRDGIIVNESSYDLQHGAWLETTKPRAGQGEGEKLTGALLVVRSPMSGNITTRYRKNTIEVQDAAAYRTTGTNDNPLRVAINRTIAYPDSNDAFKNVTLDFCVASDDQPKPNIRRNVRINIGATGSAAVRLLPQESEDSECLL